MASGGRGVKMLHKTPFSLHVTVCGCFGDEGERDVDENWTALRAQAEPRGGL